MKKSMKYLNFGLLIAFLAFSVNVFAQPANDECANAMDISSLFDGACNISNLSMVIDNTGATGNVTDPPEPGDDVACPGLGSANLFGDAATVMETSIWFTFTVPDLNGDGSPVSYSLWTSDGSYGDCGLNPNNILAGDADTQVAIYESNTCPDSALGVCDYFAANEDLFTAPPWISGWLDLMFTPGQTYYMLIDTWDGVVGEFCLSVTPCGTVCGDGECAPVETFCDCSGDCACDFANFTYVRYNIDTDDYSFTDDPTEIVVECSDFFGVTSDNIYLNVGATNFTDCAGNTGDITVTYDNGTLVDSPGGNVFASPATVPVGSLFFFELTPADVAVGNITVNACVDDGLGGQCCQDFVFDFSIIPNIANPYCPCVAGSVSDPAIITQTACPSQTIEVCTDGNEDLSLTCPAGFTYQYAWRVSGDIYGTVSVLTNWVVAGPCATLNVDDFLIDEFGYAPPNFTPGDPLGPGLYTIQGAALCVDAMGNIDSGCIASGEITVTVVEIDDPACSAGPMGCTDPAFCEYDPNATVDDGSCVTSNADPGTCDDGDCSNGLETWDMVTCTCLAGTPPTDLGCTDANFCEYDPTATCDDGSCVTSNADPGTCDDGDCSNGLETWDAITCTCVDNPPSGITGCTDAMFCEYDPTADCDDLSCITPIPTAATIAGGPFSFCAGDGTPDFVSGITLNGGSGANGAWVVTDDQLNILGLPAMPGDVDFDGAGFGTCLIWYLYFEDGLTGATVGENAANLVGCFALSNSIEVVRENCVDPCTVTPATIAGGPFSFCAGDGTPDFVSGITLNGGSGTNGTWVVTDDQLNILGLPGMPGDVDFDGAGFGTCLIWYLYFEDGLTGATVGANAADLDGCFVLSNSLEVLREDCSCNGGDIGGNILTNADCDVSGTSVIVTDAGGNPVGVAIVDGAGNWSLAGGPFDCGDYIAILDAASIPACYIDAGGEVGPAGFTVGDGGIYGVDFSSYNEVPTLSQWGLMSLALLLMIFGAIKLATVSNVQINRRKA